VLTKDNPEYLYVTLKSLTATETFGNPIVVVDDCSAIDKTKTFLYTNETLQVKFDDWTVKDNESTQELCDKEAASSYLNIPQIVEIFGIKKKFSVVKTPRYLGRSYRTLFGMKLAFDLYPTSRECVILDDDILFNRDWLKKMKQISSFENFKGNVGLTSAYSEKMKPGLEAEYSKNESIRGKCVMVSKKLYDKMKTIGLFKNMRLSGEGSFYDKLQRLADRLGFISLVTRDSYIQSLEKRNIVNKDKILKYDKNFVMPIAWNESF
jgi:hypothetical protein